MALKQTIHNKSNQSRALISYLTNKFEDEGYRVQVLGTYDNVSLVQVQNTSDSAGGLFKKIVGLGTVASLKVERSGNDLILEAAGGKWIDKAGPMVVSWFVLWPLFVTGSVGMVRQNNLIKRVFSEAVQYLV